MQRFEIAQWFVRLALAVAMVGCGDDHGEGGQGGASSATTSAASQTSSKVASTATVATSVSASATDASASASTADTSTASASSAQSSSGAGMLVPPDAGITNCHASFIEADGQCRPSLAKCAPGTIPDVDVGCVPVGVSPCAPGDECGPPGPCANDELYTPHGCLAVHPNGCGPGRWGNVVALPGDVYVDAAYIGTSDGTRDGPFVTLMEAADVVQPGGRIVLAAGSYTSAGTFANTSIEGVCRGTTWIIADGVPGDAALHIVMMPGDEATIRGVTLAGLGPGIDVSGGTLHVEGVSLGSVVAFGIVTRNGATADFHRFVISSVFSGEATDAAGIYVCDDCEARVTSSALDYTLGTGLVVAGGVASLENTFIQIVHPLNEEFPLEPDDGFFARVESGGSLVISNSELQLSARGVRASDPTTTLRIERSRIGSTYDYEDGDLVALRDGATGTIEGAILASGACRAIHAYDGASFTVNASLIDEVIPGGFGVDAVGIESPSACRITKTVVTRSYGSAIACGPGSTVEGVIIEDFVLADRTSFQTGIIAQGAPFDVQRSFISGAHDYGFLALTPLPTNQAVRLVASRIEDTRGLPMGMGQGAGFAAGSGIVAEVEDTVIVGSHGAGILLTDASATVRRCLVRDVAAGGLSRAALPTPPIVDAPFAEGLLFQDLTQTRSVTLEDVWLDGYARAGVLLGGRTHEMTRVHASGGQYGLVLQSGATSAQTMCELGDNTTSAVLDPGNFVLP